MARLNAAVGVNGTIVWDEDVSPRPGDYHGTPCLGVAVAEGNGTGVVGVAPGCPRLRAFPAEHGGAHFVAMFQKISGLADVVSLFVGRGAGGRAAEHRLPRCDGHPGPNRRTARKGVDLLYRRGQQQCPGPGALPNTKTYRFRTSTGIKNLQRPDRPLGCRPPGRDHGQREHLSQDQSGLLTAGGKQISVCAPSDNWDDLGEISQPGLGITTTDNEGFGLNTDFTPGSRFTDQFGGTSSATPTVAGVCALVVCQRIRH